MHDPCDKPFLLVSCDDLGLHHWPTSRSTLLPGGDHNSLNLLVMFTLPAMKYSKTNQWQSSNLFKRNAPRKCTCHVGCGLIDVLNKRHYFIGRYQYMYTWDLVCYFQTIAVAMYYEVYDHNRGQWNKVWHPSVKIRLFSHNMLLFLCPRIEWSGAYCFWSVCLFVCLSVCLLSTLTFAITFEP